MATTIGNEYEHIDFTHNNITTRHPIKDATARSMVGDIVKISDSDPQLPNNKIWIKETPNAEVQVPTYEEFEEVKAYAYRNKNLIDPAKASSGVSDYIPIDSETRYVLTHKDRGSGNFSFTLYTYDANKANMQMSFIELTPGEYEKFLTFNTGRAYLKITVSSAPDSIDNTDISRVYLGKFSDGQSFVPYHYSVDEQIDNRGYYTKPVSGIPVSDIASGVIPVLTDLIDDTAGVGDSTKVWSADKTATETNELKSAMNEYGMYSAFDGRFTGTKYTANSNKYFLVKTISQDCTIKRVVWAGESNTPNIAVVRDTTVVGLYTLLPNSGAYKTADVSILCKTGDMIFIGGANKCCYEKTDSSVESEKEFPNTNVAVGNTVTITSNPTVYFRWDIALFAVIDGIFTNEINNVSKSVGDVFTMQNTYPDYTPDDGYFINAQGQLQANSAWSTIQGIPFSKGTKIWFSCENNNEVFFYCIKDENGSVLQHNYTTSGLSEYEWISSNANAKTLAISYTLVTTNRVLYTSDTTVETAITALKSDIGGLHAEQGEFDLAIDNNSLKFIETENEYELFGRWYLRDNMAITNNDGSEIFFSHTGSTALTLKFDWWKKIADNTPYIVYSIDGGTYTRTMIDATVDITLPDNGWHFVRVMIDGMPESSQADSANKWTGMLFVVFKGIETTGTTKGLYPVNKIGVFFGDSITEGVCCLGNTSTSANNSASNAFPNFCCKKLNAVPYYVGYGGSGLLNNGSFRPCETAVAYFDQNTKTGFVPADFIVVNHGINDYSQTDSAFQTAYESLIALLKKRFPDIPIFMVLGFNSGIYKFANEMKIVADANSKVYYIDTQGWETDTTDGTHLTPTGAQMVGEKLADEILKVLGKHFFE